MYFKKVSSSSYECVSSVVRGMAAVHAHSIMHSDLKPSNILLQADGTPWVTDFGLAASTSTDSITSRSVAARGTLLYNAPETFDNKRFPKSDVYSSGVFIWQVIMGTTPWEGRTVASITKAIIIGDRPEMPGMSVDWRDELRSREDLPPALNTSLATALITLIEDCWAQTPLDRPPFERGHHRPT